MNIEKEMLENCSLNKSALLDYGFIKCQERYKYSTKIMNNKFRVDLTIDSNGKITGKIFDLKNLEEYTNFRIKNFGSFSATVVEEYRKVLKSMLYKKIFVNDQANRIYKNIINSYRVNPEFL